ncbi:cyclic nucleotide-binding domain-containing protein [Allomesorhizobium camelthorni]|uniref:Cyclic nucleotide-binding domain-containing protein n=1 Tax=Allomesorhizobium camelthorni TaxID=475069 RepID=A0A6G4W6N7_9HYPH|nr:cyclic nucleotide-binding domain-containing protein [Mesorhizobium camelthorni]NGO49830.1 cyclic nucleotide-binding domain-containing protein [Mesorhizobium camelthorni]
MALDDEIRILSGVRLFEGFSQEQLRLLAFGAETMHLAADRKLYREDDEADSAYVVIKGTISLFREQGDQRIPVGTAEAGAMLGELALIADTRRLTSAAAATDAEILRLNRKMFHRILEEYPELAITLRQRIVDDLQALVRRIEAVAARFEN